MTAHFIQLGDHIFSEEFPFTDPRLVKHLHGFCENPEQDIPDPFGIGGFLFHGKNIRKTGQGGNSDIVSDPELVCHFRKMLPVFLRNAGIVHDCLVGFRQVFIGDENIHLAPLHIFFQFFADLRFELIELSRHLDIDVQVSVVD